jgi:hypothetical protein
MHNALGPALPLDAASCGLQQISTCLLNPVWWRGRAIARPIVSAGNDQFTDMFRADRKHL